MLVVGLWIHKIQILWSGEVNRIVKTRVRGYASVKLAKTIDLAKQLYLKPAISYLHRRDGLEYAG
jgi:hypothetical protein